MMRARAVFHWILDELKTRQSDGVIRQMVGSASVPNGRRGHAEILERSYPRFENRSHHVIALEINTPDFACSVVVVEVTGKPGVLGGELHSLRIAEMLFDIGLRS